MTALFSFSMFYLSFAPLWISIIFIDLKSIFIDRTPTYYTECISIICIIILVVTSVLILWVELCKRKEIGKIKYTVTNAIEEKTITAEFLLSYTLPLFAFDFTRWDNIILFLIFFFTLAFLCIKHKYFSVNIALEIAGYRFYKCILQNTDKIETTQIVISRKKLNGCIGNTVYLKPINNEYRLLVE